MTRKDPDAGGRARVTARDLAGVKELRRQTVRHAERWASEMEITALSRCAGNGSGPRFSPSGIRATLGSSGLYQVTHELIKTTVLDDVREPFWRAITDGVAVSDEQAYAEEVLTKAPRNRFRASLLRLVDLEAITRGRADRLDDIYGHRHDYSPELITYIVDPDFELDVDLFTKALGSHRGTGAARTRASHPGPVPSAANCLAAFMPLAVSRVLNVAAMPAATRNFRRAM